MTALARRWARSPDGALTTAFLARFFDNEITAGTNDLKTSFFWLIAFLAAPGFLAPVFMSWHWSFVEQFYGPEALRLTSRADKVLYVGYGMAAAGLLTTVVWQALLVDRRDALVLGTLPVDARRVVRTKLAALVAYVLIVAVAMHAVSSVTFGGILAGGRGLGFAVRGMVAHFVSSSLACGFVVFAVAGLQGLMLAALGPRRFARVSPIFQLAVVAAALLSLLALPTISLAVNDTLAGQGEHVRPWVLETPPAWFLGLYEVILGSPQAPLVPLAGLAGAACVLTALVTVLVYPAVYRRVMVAAVEQTAGRRQPLSAAVARRLVRWMGRRPDARATVQFLLVTMGRSERHRFALATSAGLAVAFALPVVLQWQGLQARVPAAPPVPVLVLPVATMLILMAGFRVALALPSDLKGAWMFRTTRVPAATPRLTAWQFLCLGPALPVLMTTPFLALDWGVSLAVTHATLTLAAGAAVAAYLASSVVAVPGTLPWRPERANLRTWWPAYLAAFAIITQGLAALSPRLAPRPVTTAGIVVALLVASATVLRHPVTATDAESALAEDFEQGTQTLNLN